MKTLLIVDDEYDVVDVLASILADEGYRVLTACNGREGLSRLAEVRPDLVILDLMMPIMDGRQMLEAMRAHPDYRDVQTLLVTAADDHSVARKFSVELLSKPIELELLLQTVGRLAGPAEPKQES